MRVFPAEVDLASPSHMGKEKDDEQRKRCKEHVVSEKLLQHPPILGRPGRQSRHVIPSPGQNDVKCDHPELLCCLPIGFYSATPSHAGASNIGRHHKHQRFLRRDCLMSKRRETDAADSANPLIAPQIRS